MKKEMVDGQKGGLLNNISWKFLERISAQLVTTIVSIVLARLLDPSHYGIISLVSIFITLANVFVSDGIGSALVQKRNSDSLDFTSLLLFNLGLSVILYLCLYLAAPIISSFYGNKYDLLVPVLRVLGLRIILTGVNAIQGAYISKHLLFRKAFWATLVATIISAVVGIVLAYSGFGVWALVFQYLTNTTVSSIILAFVIGRFPKLRLSFLRLKHLLGFGIKILGTNLIGTLYNQLRALIIGKMYAPTNLAYYDKGQQFPSLLVTNINSSITAVLFPQMALEQNDKVKVKQIVRKSLRFSTFLLSPMLIGMAAVAPQFVQIVFTEKWLPCVPLMQLLCVYYLFWPIHSINMQVMKALGAGNQYLGIEIIKKILDIVILLLTYKKNVLMITVGMALSSALAVFINAIPNQKLIHYSVIEQLKDIMPSLLSAVVMGVAVYMMNMFRWNVLLLLTVQVAAGCGIYIFLSAMMKSAEFYWVIRLIKSKIRPEH